MTWEESRSAPIPESATGAVCLVGSRGSGLAWLARTFVRFLGEDPVRTIVAPSNGLTPRQGRV